MDETTSPSGTVDPGAPPAPAAFPPLDGVEHRFLDLPSLRMHVATAGTGEPVLLLHGFPQHWWEWRKVIPGLASDHRLLVPDLRGAGWTDAPREGYDRDQLLADTVALLDALELDRVHVIGHDWGALLGIQLALRQPERVRSFLCLATPHPYLRFRPVMLTSLWRLWFQPVVATAGLGPRLLSRGRQRLPRYLLSGYSSAPDVWTEEDVEQFVAPLRDPAHARAGSALYRDFILTEARRIIAGKYRGDRLRTPTLVLYGADEPGIDLGLLGGYEEYTDDLEVDLLPGASHFLPEERPDLVVERARALFARH